MPSEHDIEQDFAEAVNLQRRRELANMSSPVALALRRKLRIMVQGLKDGKRKSIFLRSDVVDVGEPRKRLRLDVMGVHAAPVIAKQVEGNAGARTPTPLARAGEQAYRTSTEM